uniref:Uncharacterized protein n=1 Tax=Romanomermis culicivorax TaxID=13658 RepID=A0A915IX61_ROMCU
MPVTLRAKDKGPKVYLYKDDRIDLNAVEDGKAFQEKERFGSADLAEMALSSIDLELIDAVVRVSTNEAFSHNIDFFTSAADYWNSNMKCSLLILTLHSISFTSEWRPKNRGASPTGKSRNAPKKTSVDITGRTK